MSSKIDDAKLDSINAKPDNINAVHVCIMILAASWCVCRKMLLGGDAGQMSTPPHDPEHGQKDACWQTCPCAHIGESLVVGYG